MGNIWIGIGVNWTCIFRSIKHKTVETCFTSICTISSHIFGKICKWKWLKSVGHHSLCSMDFEFFGMQLMWLESVCGIQIVHRSKNHSFQWLMCHSSAFLLFLLFLLVYSRGAVLINYTYECVQYERTRGSSSLYS